MANNIEIIRGSRIKNLFGLRFNDWCVLVNGKLMCNDNGKPYLWSAKKYAQVFTEHVTFKDVEVA